MVEVALCSRHRPPAPGPRPRDLRLRGRRPRRRPGAGLVPRHAARRGSAPSSRAPCCSPTSTSTTRAPPGCSAGAIRTSRLRARARRAAPGRPFEAARERRAAVRRRHGGALGRGRARARGADPTCCQGGENVEGFHVAYTPGHASHHVCYLHEDTGDAYVGDVAGVRMPPYELVVAPTPPPDIDVEAWLARSTLIASWSPQRSASRTSAQVDGRRRRTSSRMRDALTGRPSSRPARRRGALRRQARSRRSSDAVDPATLESLRCRRRPPEQLYLGLERATGASATRRR